MSNLQRLTTASYGIECWLRKQGLKSTTKFVSDITAEFLKFKNYHIVNLILDTKDYLQLILLMQL